MLLFFNFFLIFLFLRCYNNIAISTRYQDEQLAIFWVRYRGSFTAAGICLTSQSTRYLSWE